ncbi:hypothetical protein [Desulfuromonas thiophila]|uniref:hypothetical protein n=1 Tax=Desulfuromonas thiophila TaxID=57664 RepID=UPI0024A960C4|nr:hypothetical protein [Desulfuromonas thiophila]
MPHQQQIRQLIAREAARLIYEEGLDYSAAKHKAGKAYGSDQALSRGHYLPANTEIHTQLRELMALYNPPDTDQQLDAMRYLALEFLQRLEPFNPYLTGDVLRGELTPHSLIELHLFADDPDEVEIFLNQQNIAFTAAPADAHQQEQQHLLSIDDQDFPLLCHVFPRSRRQQGLRSPIDGQPLPRASARQLQRLLENPPDDEETP